MLSPHISPSVMCADPLRLAQTLDEFARLGVDYLHLDIMDGHFVRNFTLGTDFVRAIKAASKIPLDLHLMIERPEERLDWFTFDEGDYVSVHAESTPHLQRALSAIRARGAKPMAAINPATPICMLEPVLDDIDAILVMTVNPGFAGQRLVASTLKKIACLREMLDQNGYGHIEIEVDGNVSFANARLMRDAGANIFVAGSSSVFHPDYSLENAITELRKQID